MPDPTNPVGGAVAQPVEANPQANIVVVPEAGQQQNDQFIPRPRIRSRSTEEVVMRDVKTTALLAGGGIAAFLILSKIGFASPVLAALGPIGLGIAMVALMFGIFLAANSATNYIEAGSSTLIGHRSPGEALEEANQRTLQGVTDVLPVGDPHSPMESLDGRLPRVTFTLPDDEIVFIPYGQPIIVPHTQPIIMPRNPSSHNQSVW